MMGRIEGLYIGGVVHERRRRHIKKGDDEIEIITYKLVDSNDRSFYVEDYAPSEYYDLSAQVCAPVYIKPYRKNNGQLSYTICFKKDFASRGEIF